MNSGCQSGNVSEEQVDRLFAAIRGLDFTHTKAAVFFYMTIDLIMITFGRPLAAKISMAGRPRHSFQTAVSFENMHEHPAPVFLSRSDRRMDSDLHITLYKPKTYGETPESVRLYLSAAHDLVSRISNKLRDESRPMKPGHKLGALFWRGFHDILPEGPRRLVSDEHIRDGVDASEADRMLGGFFKELQQLFSNQNYNVNFEDKPQPDGFLPASPRLLFSHYFVNEDKQLDLRLHLLESQQAALNGRKQARGVAALNPDIERGFRNASIHRIFPGLKAAASSGIATWLEGGASIGGRQRAEAPWRALVLPIHVQFLPWLVVSVIFTPAENLSMDDDIREEWAQHFYTHFFPQVIATARQLAHDHYLQEVEKRAQLVLKHEGPDPGRLEAALAPLTATFPYSDIHLEPARATDPRKTINWQGHTIHVASRPNHGHARGRQWIPFRTLETKKIPKALMTAQKLYESEESGKDQSHGGAYFNFSHTIKNLIESTGRERAIATLAPVSDYCAEEPDWHTRPNIRARVVEALDFADRALSLSLLIKGFGYFGRVLGMRRQDVDLKKFINWLPAEDELPVADADILKVYAESISHFARAICFGRQWIYLDVTWDDRGKPILVENEKRKPFSTRNLHFPPFAPRAEAAYPFIFAMAEPLQNAINALKLFPSSQYSTLASPLQIAVRRDRRLTGGIIVTISNLCVEEKHRPRSGLADAARMLQPLGLVQFSDLSFEPEGHYFRATMDVKLNPAGLAERIRREVA